MASEKQINYALSLLSGAGYSTRYMDKEFKDFGATMRERSGTVENWLRRKTVSDLSSLIDRLKEMQPYKASADAEVRDLRAAAGPDRDVDELRRLAKL